MKPDDGDEEDDVVCEIVMVDVLCGHCGMPYMVPDFWLDERKRTHQSFYCPNGGSRWYPPPEEKVEAAAPEKGEEEGAWAWLTRAFKAKA